MLVEKITLMHCQGTMGSGKLLQSSSLGNGRTGFVLGWRKANLKSGEGKAVQMAIDQIPLSINERINFGWRLVSGNYLLKVGESSTGQPLSESSH